MKRRNEFLAGTSICKCVTHSQFFDVLNNDETIRMHSTSNTSSQQLIKNARSSIKKQGLKTRLKPTKQTISNTKLNIKSIKSKLSKFDIICLQETWAKDETLTFQGYTVYSTVKNTVSRRGQAGVSVLIRDHHQNFVSRIHSDFPQHNLVPIR